MNRYNLVRFSQSRVKTIIARNMSYGACFLLKGKYDKTSKLNNYDYRMEQISYKKLKNKSHTEYIASC